MKKSKLQVFAFALVVAMAAVFVGFAPANSSNTDKADYPPSLMQKFSSLAFKYLHNRFQADLVGTNRTIISGGAVDSKLQQYLSEKSIGVRNHVNAVLQPYMNFPGRKALLVTNIQGAPITEMIVVSIPTQFRLPPNQNLVNYVINNSESDDENEQDWCDYCTGKNDASPPPNSVVSVFEAGFDSDCSCICDCNDKSSGPCGDECTDC